MLERFLPKGPVISLLLFVGALAPGLTGCEALPEKVNLRRAAELNQAPHIVAPSPVKEERAPISMSWPRNPGPEHHPGS